MQSKSNCVQDHTARILECMIPGVPSARLRIQQPAIDFQGPQRNVVERRRLMKLRHVVLFGFGKAQSPAATAEVIRRFADLKAQVPGIDDFEWGENSSPRASTVDTATFSCSLLLARGRVTLTLCIPITQPFRTGSSHLCLR